MSNLFTNCVNIAGNLTRDPELRYTADGTAICKLSLAINERFKKKGSDEYQEKAVFVDLVAWRKTAEYCGEYLEKGNNVYVIGKLNSSEWQTQEGQKRKKLEVTVEHIQHNRKDEYHKMKGTPKGTHDESQEEIPF
jgi:single-strand DNA-binding protein